MRRPLAIAAVALAGFGASQVATAANTAPSPRTCFAAKNWGPAPESVRPCVRITRVEEDGSFEFSVSDADGTVRYTSGVGALDR